MKILKEFACPHCGKKIQYIQVRRPTTVRKNYSDTSSSISMRRGVYKYKKG